MLKYRDKRDESVWRKQLASLLTSKDEQEVDRVVRLFADQLRSDQQADQQHGKVTDCAFNTPRLHSHMDKHNSFAHKLAVLLFPPTAEDLAKGKSADVLKKFTYIQYSKLLSTLSGRFRSQTEAEARATDDSKKVRYIENRKNFCTLKARPPSDLILNPTPMPVTVPPREELQPFFDYMKTNVPVTEGYLEFKRGIHYDDNRMDMCKMVVGPPHIGALMESIRDNPYVEHFLLGNNIIGLEGARQVSAFIKAPHAGKIQTWYLAGNELNSEGVRLIADALASDKDANALWLKRNPVKPEGAHHLANLLRRNNSIKILDLDNTGILDEGAVAIFEALKDNRRMRHLYMSANALTPVTARAIAAYFRHLVDNNLRGLKTLWLSINRLDDEGVIQMVESLRGYKWLKTLDIGANRMTAVSAKVVCEVFKQVPLQCLSVSLYKSSADLGELCNDLQDAGAEYVADLIESNVPIRYLDVIHNGITLKGVQRMADAMRKNNHLYVLGYRQLGLEIPGEIEEGIRQKLKENVSNGLGVSYDEFTQHRLRSLKHFGKIKNIDSNYRNSMK